ncbi:MAG: hypothetical protein MJY55_06860 [Bacteroidales bacterium]|nr:hypothetical protein [Bacteroidales bacterium]
MKKIVMIFAAMAAVLSSCQKSELESVSVNDGKDIVLNISVSNPGADDTKALIKQGWVENDEISIWYDSNVQENPDLVVKYDGAKWIQKEGATVSRNTPSEGDNKYAKALYNGTVKVASKDDYTYDGTTLTFKIEHWAFLTEVQVVVKELDKDKAGSYTLSCDKFTPLAAGNGYTVVADAITASSGTKGDAVTGISNTDGVAFVFATADYSETAADYKFTLTDNTSTPAVTKEYTATTDKISGTTGSMTAIKALTIESISFTAPGPEYVEMKMGASGNNTLKWATMNLGAKTIAGNLSTCAGDYYQWGSVDKLYNSITWADNITGSFVGLKEGGFAETNLTYKDNADLSDATNDVVKKTYPGTNWRMPTSQDFQDLYEACVGTDGYDNTTNPTTGKPTSNGVYWCDSYDGVAGVLFYDGTNVLFFPAAGYGDGTDLNDAGGIVDYWSSSLTSDSTDTAFSLYFDSDNVYPQGNDYRYFGFSVRPVSD